MKRALLAALLLCAAPAFAALPGLDAYKRGDYQSAATSLRAVLLTGQLSKADAMSARMYLAASYFALGDSGKAKATLAELVESNPDATLDPNIFDPDLVAQHEQLRKEELKRREALAETEAETKKVEAETKKAEEEKPPVVVEKPVEPEPAPEPEKPSSLELRVGVFSLTDVIGKPSGTAALMVSGVISNLEVGLRAFPGSQTVNGEKKLTFAAGAEVGYLFFDGAFTPRAGLRVTIYPGLPSGSSDVAGVGFGAVGGLRYKLVDFLAIGGDVAAEVNSVPDSSRYRNFSAVLSGGAQLIF